MAQAILIKNGGGGVSSNELTATKNKVLSGKTYVGNDTNDEVATGTMPDNSTTTSNGTVPGINNSYSSIPTREGTALQMSVDTSGTSRISICPPEGYYPGNGSSYINRPSSDFGSAAAGQVLSGKTFTSTSGVNVTGTMTNNGAVAPNALNAGDSYTIPAGYHNGSGKVTTNTLASQTSADAAAGQILSGKTAWVNGSKVTGSMTNRGAVSGSLSTSTGSYTIPAGYHNGSGTVTMSKANMAAYLGYSGITSFKVSSYTYNSITVSWVKPTTGGFSGLRLVLKAGSAPTSITDGTYVNSTGTSYTFSGLSLNTTYYITAYPYVTFTNYKTKYYNQASITKSVNIGNISKYGNVTQMNYGRYWLTAATANNIAIFAGGYYWNSSGYFYPKGIDIYNTSRTHSYVDNIFTYGMWGPAGAKAGNYAVIAGGWTGTQSSCDSKGGQGYPTTAYFINNSGTKASTSTFTGRMWLGATNAGNIAIFGGGYSSGYLTTVEAYNSSATKLSSVSALSKGRSELAATSVGSIALFGGGRSASSTMSNVVDIYNSSGTRTGTATLSKARYDLAAASAGSYGIFGGGRSSTSSSGGVNTVDIFNTSGTRTSTNTLSVARYRLCATNVGYYAIFAGGCTASTTCSAVVDYFNGSLTKSTLTGLTDSMNKGRSAGAATSAGNYAFIGGGYYGTSSAWWYFNYVDAYQVTYS